MTSSSGCTYRASRCCWETGASVEDYSPTTESICDISLAAERVAAAVDAAHGGASRLVVTARAENHFRGVDDLDDTIARLVAYQQAGADVLYAPAVKAAADIARLVAAVERPVNVLAIPGVPPVAELAELGVARVSVGTGFWLAAAAGALAAAGELLDLGTYDFWAAAAAVNEARRAFDA